MPTKDPRSDQKVVGQLYFMWFYVKIGFDQFMSSKLPEFLQVWIALLT